MRSTCVSAVGLLLTISQFASADLITQTLGDISFTDNTSVTTGAFITADGQGDPVDVAPFNGVFCGVDSNNVNTGFNWSASWTFNAYTVPQGDTITGATIGIGIGDLDSAAAGNQIASLIVAGVDVTAAINTIAEANASANLIYRQYVITLPNTAFAQIAAGTVAVSFATQGPGLGVLGPTTFNGVNLDYSQLNITAQAPVIIPEPATAVLLVPVLGLGALLYRRKRR